MEWRDEHLDRSSESIGGEASISVRRSISYPNPIPSYVVLPRSAAVTSFIHVCVRAGEGGRGREKTSFGKARSKKRGGHANATLRRKLSQGTFHLMTRFSQSELVGTVLYVGWSGICVLERIHPKDFE